MRNPFKPQRAPEVPPAVPTATLAGAAALGGTGGSGMVNLPNELQRYGGNVQTMLPGTVVQNVQVATTMPPDSLYADRQLHGGVTTFPAFSEFKAPPAFMGGYAIMANQPALAPIEGEHMQAPALVSDAQWRDAPSVVTLCRSLPSEVGVNNG